MTPVHLPLKQPHIFPVFRADDMRCLLGANQGDNMGFAAELVPDDVYCLVPTARVHDLSLRCHTSGFSVSEHSPIGEPRTPVHLDCAITCMGSDGSTVEALILVAVDNLSHAKDVFVLPICPLSPDIAYRLIDIDVEAVSTRMAELTCAAFGKGTQITLANGTQCAVENLEPGDLVLTRDDGIRPIRSIGHRIERATGLRAPVRIPAGTLYNSTDLLVSPEHRFLIYQRQRHGAGDRPEITVKASQLWNQTSIVQDEAGYVQYYQLVFDTHQIIFAEGIAAETMRPIDLDYALDDKKSYGISRHIRSQNPAYREFDIEDAFFDGCDAIQYLQWAARG
ncbi:MAG: Hint domain-containing protein [Roseobacter sp.]